MDDIALIAHLMRRAGFGATRSELERYAEQGYEATVEALLQGDAGGGIDDDVINRYHPDHSGGLGMSGFEAKWLYRMVNTTDPLEEKVALFWHNVFATGYAKLAQGRVLMDQIEMFRRLGKGDLRPLFVALSRDPSMILWLDNCDNHEGAINENFGRELLELFSMGVGNYSEDDVKECARAFTGWTVANAEYMTMRARNDSLWPYGRLDLYFEYRPDDHDDGEKTFLGQTGRFNGEDIVEVICRQEATAHFIARNMYSFFVADEPPVTRWPYVEPRDPAAIDALTRVYFDSDYNIEAMLRTLFLSDFFRSEDAMYQKVKGPAELVAGVLRLTGEKLVHSPKLQTHAGQLEIMGQNLVNPPSVEGWHEGIEWIDSGSLMDRVNYASEQFADDEKPGIRAMVDGLGAGCGTAEPEDVVQAALDQMGAFAVSGDTRAALVEFAGRGNGDTDSRRRAAELLRLVAAAPDFQKE